MSDTLVDLLTERRILAALIAEPEVLDAADELETEDFSDPRHQTVLAGIRQLRSDGADVDAGEIHDRIRLWDLEHGKHIAESAGIWFLTQLLLDTAPYRSQTILVDHDLWWLRELSVRRRRHS